ncbi:amidohydrolase family protein [Gluconobacter morbifer]|uniref:Organophopsphate acid anhydrase n=1 Tax=Gluconobacter morbifer G707 TaxID=1088869 RepID=G6XMI0_9PROT|nr:amidohydrolase family protein [Gluconobacter morbifer]EHH67078.1 organophopsphate acid anhydrase [Gluconobacter morbifer G707]
MFRRSALTTLLLATSATLSVQGARAEPVAFDHARVVDGTGASARSDVTVVVDNGIIVSVGTPAPAEARHVDLTGRTLMPALISDHSHVGLVKGTGASRDNYTRENILAALKQYSRYGVLTVTALGLNRSPLFDDLRREQHEGRNPGADLYGVDQGIGAAGGVPPVAMVKGLDQDQVFRPTTPEETRQDVDKMISEHTDLVKLWVDDFRNDVPDGKTYPIMPPAIYKAAIDEAHLHNTRVAVHIHDLDVAKAIVASKADILAHGVRDKPVDHDLISAMQQQGTWYIATLDLDEANYLYAEHPDLLDNPFVRAGLNPALRKQFSDPKWRSQTLAKPLTNASHYALSVNQKNLAVLYRAGIHIGFGTDSGASPTRVPGFAEHRELYLTTQAGLSPVQAISLATGNAAALLHLWDRGVIAPGKRADLLIVKGNADQDIAVVDQIEQVWQRGKLVSHGPVADTHG